MTSLLFARFAIAGGAVGQFPKVLLVSVLLAITANCSLADSLTRRQWQVDGINREALVYIPASAKTNASPVVFAFHGHGGTMQRTTKMFPIHELWPEAIAVYMQGLNTPGQLTDPEGKKPGWQRTPGDQGDRDLKFFDAVLASLKQDYKVNTNRVYATGHSNGGSFTYLLWTTRAGHFAAFAPSASIGRSLLQQDEKLWAELMRMRQVSDDVAKKFSSGDIRAGTFVPRPVLHIAGDNDPLVKYEWQKLMIAALRQANQCGGGKTWDKNKRCTIYESKAAAPVITYIHQGRHGVPPEVPEIVVEFFKSIRSDKQQ